MLARYANLQFYGNMLAETGFEREVETVRAAWKAKDAAAAEAAVTDAMADAVTLVGDPAACRKRIRAYRMAGADRVVVFPNPVGEPRAAAVERALEGLAPRRD
jgi:alkanesulfonate monooxygenase SsuD/methylene tetrahydromethanopterin reductase-like flavin-dependent oxidoreductase (luciferase family)